MKLLMALMVVASVYAVSAHANSGADRQFVAMACAEEARLANCGGAVVGAGLLRCLRAYPFAGLSPGCQAALSQLKADRSNRVVISPNPVLVVRPTYPIPGPGYLWRQHPRYGWGWYHPRLGWHRGWR